MMSLSQFPKPLRQLRSILSELRKGLQLSGGQGVRRQNLGETQGVRHLLSQYRSNAVTQEQVCRHRQEMEFLADTYNTYLRCALNLNSLKYLSISHSQVSENVLRTAAGVSRQGGEERRPGGQDGWIQSPSRGKDRKENKAKV